MSASKKINPNLSAWNEARAEAFPDEKFKAVTKLIKVDDKYEVNPKYVTVKTVCDRIIKEKKASKESTKESVVAETPTGDE